MRPQNGNLAPGILDSLLAPTADQMENQGDSTDAVTDTGNVDSPDSLVDHSPCVSERSEAQLICYAAGYAARKNVLASKCVDCKALCLLQQSEVPPTLPAAATKEWDMGGLLYQSEQLFKLILILENKLEQVFSTFQLHAGLMVEVVSSL
ncbi:unnamed protein product, partial [Ixodes persulcatus]